ncbi:PQQ-binding-like beta-propeller repeat protein [Solwaraspora sp. WMMD1047]|uniref:outer membrane protein assembly factor BamB family protein n=1 Tax=Solwaraspora sp. WMMD1047 TaxID=3016102 RepID=UPI002417CC32|nr:PQQ-binding-like beta-propeller repeat protein [Solwaraspora sp. WMMD1047]MDG4829798.1 PQQ-binding-like beta-propeller repeat protein [Solwaraspora sp. WMMD1047]
MAAIELGEMSAASTAHRPPAGRPRPVATRAVRRMPRWPRLGGTLAVLLAGVAAAAPVARPPAEATVPARQGALTISAPDRIFVADPPGEAAAGDRWLAAYRLPDGAPLWRVPMPLSGPLGNSLVLGGTLVLTVDWSSVARRETVGLDAATGLVRWRRTATLEGVTAAGDVLLWAAPGQTTVTDNPPGTLLAVAAADAAQRWSLPLPAGTLRSYRYERGPTGDPGEVAAAADRSGPVRATALVVSRPGGRVEIRDLAAAAVLRAADLPGRGPVGASLPARVAGDLLLVDDGSRTVTAYGLDRLDHRWQLTRDPGREYGPIPCGAGLCLYRRHGGVRAADPATGRTVWTDGRWENLTRVGDRLLASRSGAVGAAPLTVLDPATGEVRGELGAWQVVRVVAGAGRLTGVRVAPDGTAWVAELDPAAARVRVLQPLRDVVGDCAAEPGVLICRRLDGSVGVWRI